MYHNLRPHDLIIFIIVDWTDYDVWSFLRDAHIPINPCYSMGLHRVGCIACPMASPKERAMEFRIWPKYEILYRKAFGRMLEHRRRIGKVTRWRTADDIYRWWMEDKNLDGQLDFFGGEVGAYEA